MSHTHTSWHKFDEDLANDPISETNDIVAHLRLLLDGGVAKLPISQPGHGEAFHRTVPLFIMATAGMRNNNGEPTRESAATMRHAWDTVHALQQGVTEDVRRRKIYKIGVEAGDIPDHTSVRFNVIRDRYSFVVPAKDEGVYAWIAQNYGLDRSDSQMFGVLELGGKSMQVAYADATDAGGKAVCLWKSRYYVNSRSFVLGVEESRAAAVERKLITAINRLPGKDIYNPCLPSLQHVEIANGREVIGNGDFAKCLAMAEFYLNTKLGTDSLSSLDIQHFANRFYGVSSFWYTYHFFSQFGVYKIDSPYDPHLFRQAVEKYCTSSWFPWSEMPEGPRAHLHKHCFAAAWMITLLHDRKGFQLQPSNHGAWKDLLHIPKIGDRSSWTLGAAVMAIRHGNPKTFCNENEWNGEYPPALAGLTSNQTAVFSIPSSPKDSSSIVSSTPVVVVAQSVQPVRTLSIPTAIAGRLLPDLPLGALNPGSTFSVGLVFSVIALVLIGYRRFSNRRPAPVSEEKHVVEVDEQPGGFRTRLAFFDKTKGAIFLAGRDNISYA